ncbi:hypothetical protein [Streptacidiphilus albus]|uniref:hypothetical protein n=1 Tax=Streptacidiphilus albus TaxID=105425 RepID=UPI00128DA702|nr:hypothetical protein [Streptacidiphilus albus]
MNPFKFSGTVGPQVIECALGSWGSEVQEELLGNPRWRIALWTLLVEVTSLTAGLAVPGWFILIFSSGCFSPGQSDQTEPQNFDPTLVIGGVALACVAVISAVMALKLLFASERGDAKRVRWLQCQLSVQLALILTIAALMTALHDPHRIDQCYPTH